MKGNLEGSMGIALTVIIIRLMGMEEADKPT